MAVTIGIALLALALFALIWALRMRAATGLPWAPVVYQDADSWEPERPLMARKLGLVGKPDYLMRVRGRLIPVEVKPGRTAARPYESDLMQLAAYCVLVEETSGDPPPYGLLRYAEHTFRLRYDERVRAEVLGLLDEIRDGLTNQCDRSHDDGYRCRGCGFYEQCDQALD